MTPLVATAAQGCKVLACSKTTFLRWARRADFPLPIVIDDGRRRWFRSDLRSWLKSQQIPAGVLAPHSLPATPTAGLAPSGPAAPALLACEAQYIQAGLVPRDLRMIGPASPGESIEISAQGAGGKVVDSGEPSPAQDVRA